MTQADFAEQMVAQMPYLRALAVSMSGSWSVADDLVQETLVKAWAHADSFAPGSNMRAWLVTILRNTFFSHYRKSAREVQDSDNVHAEQTPVKGEQEATVSMGDVQRALNKLAPEHREILLMIGIAELSYEETAEICNIAVGTVKSRLNRARVKLAEHLGLVSPHEILKL